MKGNRGFTLVEAAVSALLISVISAGLFMAFNIGNTSSQLTSPKVDLQARVREILDIVCRDLRQTISWEIADDDNDPSSSHIKFRLVQGWNATGNNISFIKSESGTDYYYYVEYTFASPAQTLTRTETKVRVSDSEVISQQDRVFNNITAAPFYTRNSAGTKVALNDADILTSRRVVVALTCSTQARGLTYQLSLEEEVKVRNE